MQYYYILNQQRQGPVEAHELPSRGVTPETLVWASGMTDWMPAAQVPEVAALLAQNAAPTPPTPPPFAEQPQPFAGAAQPFAQQPQPWQQTPQQNPYGPQPANPYAPQGQRPRPDNYLVWAILCTLCCCLIGGIVAIVKACDVNKLYDRGDVDGAYLKAQDAKNWTIWSAVIGFVAQAIYCFVYVADFLG